MKFISRVSLVALCCATVFHCSGKSNMQVATPGNNDIKAPNEATSVQARVLADTGATLAIGNSLQLTVPAGALSQDTDITVEKKSVAPAQGIVVPVAKSIELGAHGTQFNKTVALNVCYDPQVLASQGLYEETLAVYYVDAQTGEYGSVGGSVNKTTHCVSANIEHFSTYLVAAQNLSVNLPVADQLPQISVTYLPGTPIAGLPVKVRAAITDFKLTPVSNGTGVQVGFGQIATVRYCYYTAPATACPGGLQNLAPDYDDEANNFYSFVIPASQVTTQGFTVSYEVYNSLGFKRTRTVNYVPTRTATGIQFTSNAVVNLAAGFKRSYTVQGVSDTGTPQNIPVDSFTLNGGIGTATQTGVSVIRVTGTTANPQAMRTGSLTATAGAFSVTSADINVHAGLLDHISLLSPAGVVLGNTITINANTTYDFDILGYDAFGNTSNVLPQFVLVPVTGAGTISSTGLYTAPATAQSATLVATLNGVADSILINVVVPSNNGDVAWIREAGGTSPAGVCSETRSAVDTAGKIFVAGCITNNFGGIPFISQTGMFLVKYDTNGNILWSQTLQGAANASVVPLDIATDQANNTYVTGYFGLDINGVPAYDPSSIDMFLVKYDSSGSLIWLRTLSTNAAGASLQPRAVTVDSASNIFVAGFTTANLDGQTFSGYGNGFVTKYDTAGNRLWTRLISGSGASTSIYGITPNGTGGVYTAGSSNISVDSAVVTGASDIMLNSFDGNGNRLWSSLLGGIGLTGHGRSVKVDGLGNIVIGGYINGTIAGQAATASLFNNLIAKFSPSGGLQWVRIHNVTTTSDTVSSIGIDGANNIYVTGTAFDPINQLYTNLYPAAFLLKVDSVGSLVWSRLIGAGYSWTAGDGLVVDQSGAVFVSGGTNANLGDQTLHGSYDYFLAKYQ